MTFEQAANANRNLLKSLALKLTKNHADAEDLLQDTLTQAFAAWGNFNGENPRAWLATILRNRFLNNASKRALRARTRDERHTELAERLHSTAASFDGLGDESRAALASLPEDFRAVLVRACLRDMSYKEISAELGIPAGTVMSRLNRARSRMRAELEQHAINTGVVRAAKKRRRIRGAA